MGHVWTLRKIEEVGRCVLTPPAVSVSVVKRCARNPYVLRRGIRYLLTKALCGAVRTPHPTSLLLIRVSASVRRKADSKPYGSSRTSKNRTGSPVTGRSKA